MSPDMLIWLMLIAYPDLVADLIRLWFCVGIAVGTGLATFQILTHVIQEFIESAP